MYMCSKPPVVAASEPMPGLRPAPWRVGQLLQISRSVLVPVRKLAGKGQRLASGPVPAGSL